jgi:hypothetical protein
MVSLYFEKVNISDKIVLSVCIVWALFQTLFILAGQYRTFKGIVQRDLTGVKIRLKQSVMMNYIVANFTF